MCLHASRFDSRIDENNSIILLQHQDRSTWSQELIQQGYCFLDFSSQGDELTIYHLESAIAAEHSMAASFEATNWKRMLKLYDMLLEQKRTPMVLLNRAIVMAQLQQAPEAIQEIWQIPGIETLLNSQYIFSAVLGELYWQSGDERNARVYLQQAHDMTPSLAEKKLIAGKMDMLDKAKMN
jgi:RNA polymerase sigma-70 factor (ECF subfamily)